MGLTALVVASAIGFVAWARLSRYEAFPAAAAVAAAAEKTPGGWHVFRPSAPAGTGFIFYPGALVDPAAYAPLLRAVADRGALAVNVPMPLDLAVFGIRAADKVIRAYPEVGAWVIGGHSLGGAMAAQYAADNPSKVGGIVFLASYPAGGVDLSGLPLAAASVYGSRDGVAGDAPGAAVSRLPRGTVLVDLEGANHAQFGDYGPQAGDGEASMSRAEQQARTVEAIASVLSTISR